jgi:RHS repeat-associated protein
LISTSGLVVWSARYDSFGNAEIGIEGITNNLRLPGQYFDAETGLNYNWHRYYDPATGRYLRTDPYGQGLNLYAYCFNNPLTLIDPLGLCALDWTNNTVKQGWDWWSDLVTVDIDKLSNLVTFGKGLSEEEFREERARTRLAIEFADIAIQGKGWATVAFDVGGWGATTVDIYEAENVSMRNKILAHVVNAYGIFGVVGAIPSPPTKKLGVLIDSSAFVTINILLQPNSPQVIRKKIPAQPQIIRKKIPPLTNYPST